MTALADPIKFNASTGSDTAASGSGPATAVSGSAAAHTGGSASTTITLTGSPDLSTIAAGDLLWLNTASGRQFSVIASVDDGANTITVDDSFTIAEASAVDWAVGGKRATWDDADSRALLTDAKGGWIIETETDQTISSALTGVAVGSTTAGVITWRGASSTVRTITQTANAACFASSGPAVPTFWRLEHLKLQNSNGTKTSAYGVYANSGNWELVNCIFGDSTNTLNRGVSRAAGGPNFHLVDCEVCNCTTNGIVPSGSATLYATGIYVHDCGSTGILGEGSTCCLKDSVIESNAGDGIAATNSAFTVMMLDNCVIHGNTGDGIDISVGVVTTRLRIMNCNITANATGTTAYGIRAHANQRLMRSVIDYNNFGTGGLANTSGPRLNVAAGAHDLEVDPQYTDAANGNFAVGANVRAKGFPDATRYIGANQSATISYVDIGAAQHPDPTIVVPDAKYIYGGQTVTSNGTALVTGTLRASNINVAAGSGDDLTPEILEAGKVVDDITGTLESSGGAGNLINGGLVQ